MRIYFVIIKIIIYLDIKIHYSYSKWRIAKIAPELQRSALTRCYREKPKLKIYKQVLKYQNEIYYGSPHKFSPFCMSGMACPNKSRSNRARTESDKLTSESCSLWYYHTCSRGENYSTLHLGNIRQRKIMIAKILFHVKREHLYPPDIKCGAYLTIWI